MRRKGYLSACSARWIICLSEKERERERERERQTDRQTETDRQTDRQRVIESAKV